MPLIIPSDVYIRIILSFRVFYELSKILIFLFDATDAGARQGLLKPRNACATGPPRAPLAGHVE